MIPDSLILLAFAASILLAPIYYGRTKPVKEDSK